MSPAGAESVWPWAVLLVLGAVHGINPAMGWLFAVALGMQEQERRAVWRALLPLAAGHALAIAAAVAVAALLGFAVPASMLRRLVALSLVALGLARLLGHRHASRGGMRVGPRDLAAWSFLMATAHGAGLMALPFALDVTRQHHAASPHAGHAQVLTAGIAGVDATGLLAAAVHGLGYLLVTGAVALLVYDRVGLRVLRTAWVNLDLLWACALVATGAITVIL